MIPNNKWKLEYNNTLFGKLLSAIGTQFFCGELVNVTRATEVGSKRDKPENEIITKSNQVSASYH